MYENGFKIVFVACFVIGCLIRAPYARRSRRTDAKGKRSRPHDWPLLFLAFIGMQVAPLIYLVTDWLAFADWRPPAWAGIAGVPVFVAALWLLWRSHSDLGSNFSPELRIRDEHSLITSGVYRRIRHPMYAAHLLWAIAQVLLLQNWIAGPAFLATLFPLYLHRVPEEEKMMLEAFGDEYRLYMDGTGRIIPRFRK